MIVLAAAFGLAVAAFCLVVGLNLRGSADRIATESSSSGDIVPAIASPAMRGCFVISGLLVGGVAIAVLLTE